MKIRNAINPLYWANRLVDKRIQHYGKGVGTEMKYNPLLVTLPDRYNDRYMTRRLLENSVWYSGIEPDLQYFYKTEAPKYWRSAQASESLNYFWYDSNTDFRKIHSGFPQLISEKMVDLIIGNGMRIIVEGKNQEELQKELDEMLKENKLKILMSKGIETESWSGGVSWKMTRNPLISKYPILESWQPENYTNVVVSGRIVEDIFYVYYEDGDQKYRLSEMYGVNNEGAYIDYKLDKLSFTAVGTGTTKNAQWNEASFKDLEQTKDLKKITFTGYFKKLSLYKPNKLPNSEFRHSILGESDYAGSYGSFDAIDEILSTEIQEFRDSKLIRYFPEEYVPKNAKGIEQTPDDFKRNHTVYAESPSENVDRAKIQYEQGDLRTEKHLESYKMWVTQALNNAGLSPLTVGITGLESVDASAESQQEREKVSIRTRNKKIELWTEFLEEFLKTALEFHIMTKNMKPSDVDEFQVTAVPEFDIIVAFEDYIVKSKADRTKEVTEGTGITWDILTGVKYVHEDKTEREHLAISAMIKLENGQTDSLSIAEASALQDLNITATEELKEDGVEIVEIPDVVTEPLNADGTPVGDQTLGDAQVGIEDGKESVEEVLLNGAQITSAVSIVESFNTGVLSYEAALQMLMSFLNIPRDQAVTMLNKGKKPEVKEEVKPEVVEV
jgi:hypothetical protein